MILLTVVIGVKHTKETGSFKRENCFIDPVKDMSDEESNNQSHELSDCMRFNGRRAF